MVGPGDFVSIAEETGLISKIGRIVLEQACRQAAQWKRDGRDLFVSVNISPRQLTRPDLVADISHALTTSGLPANLLCLEVTETARFRDPGPIVESLRRLKALGVRIAIDDFGAGVSSFGLLGILPVDQIKIDHSFIQGLGDTTSDRAVVAAVVSLAKELGLAVIAEGVETQRQQAELRELGAELAQGFLYSPACNRKSFSSTGSLRPSRRASPSCSRQIRAACRYRDFAAGISCRTDPRQIRERKTCQPRGLRRRATPQRRSAPTSTCAGSSRIRTASRVPPRRLRRFEERVRPHPEAEAPRSCRDGRQEERQRELREAAESLREASDRLRGKKQKRGSVLGKLIVLAIVGAIDGDYVLSEDIRKAVLDRLFGAEEEFEYTSTTAPSNGGAA